MRSRHRLSKFLLRREERYGGPGRAWTAAHLRWLRGLYPLLGVIFMIIVVMPWVIAIDRATEGAFLAEAIGHDLAFKLIGSQESHGAPPFSYLLLAMATFWPCHDAASNCLTMELVVSSEETSIGRDFTLLNQASS